jgi:putative component of membrane protein insertase Oxa1/YidC/SpoIIIJ protein YidD
MKFITCLIFSIQIYCANAQESSLQNLLVQKTFSNYKYQKSVPRKLLHTPTNFWGRINPLYYVSAGMLYTYQNIISEQIQAECMYETSCSQYTKFSIEKYGLIKGTLLGFHQLNNCMPSAIYDYPDFKISKGEKILNNR